MWILFFLDNVFPKPKGKIAAPQEIKFPRGWFFDAMVGLACVVGALTAIVLGIVALF